MADLKNAIREMLRRGMTEAQVKENLAEMGVADVDLVFSQATESMHAMSPAQGNPQQAAPAAVQEREPQLSTAPQLASPGILNQGLPEDRLDEAIALLKAINELNKRILETNREILLRLKG